MHKRSALPPGLELGAVTAGEARAAGVSNKRLRSSDLEHPFHGVVVEAGSVRTLLDRCRAYQTWMPLAGFFSHSTAAMLHGLPLPWSLENELRVHVSVVAPTRAPRGEGVVGHRVDVCPALVLLGDLRVVTPVGAWCQLASVLELDDLIAVGDGLLCGRYPLASPQEVATAVREYRGRRGSRRLRDAEMWIRPRVESRRETLLRLLMVRSGFPEPETNREIPLPAGTGRVRGDLVYFRYKVLVEYDGQQHRTDDVQYNRDIERLHDLRAAGWIVITVRKDSTREWIRNAIEIALRSRGWQPGD